MNLFEKSKVYTLSEWLEIATKKLAVPAKTRIRPEIEAHYADAVASHLANGSSVYAAWALALAELGDAKTAARRFRKSHLTEQEAERIKSSAHAARSILVLLFNYSLFAFVIFVMLEILPWPRYISSHNRFQFLRFAFEVLFFIALPTTCFVMARSSRLQNNLRWLLLLQGLCVYPFGFPITGYILLVTPSFPLGIWLCILNFGTMFINSLHLSNKLGKVREIGNEAFSSDITPV